MKTHKFIGYKKLFGSAVILFSLFAVFPFVDDVRCAEPDWARVSQTRIILFYPGVASWEFVNSGDHRLGLKEIRQVRKECRYCHISPEGEIDLRTSDIASGKAAMKKSRKFFEPDPIAGKQGMITANVKAAYDNEFLYVRIEWESKGVSFNANAAKPGANDNDMVSLQINKTEQTFRKYGCFITCHTDLNTMPESPSAKDVRANPFYAALKRDDVRLYAFYARDAWNAPKSAAELDKKRKEGGRIQMLSAELSGGKAISKSGWVFDDRVWDDAPALGSTGAWRAGVYSVVLKRSLNPSVGEKFSEKDVITAGLAIHDDKSSKRRHYVSFPFTIGINANSDVTASKF